jgi:hypothetical protein
VFVAAVFAASVSVLFGIVIGVRSTPEPPVRVVTEQVEVPTLPVSCVAALDASEDVVRISERALGLSADLVRDTADLQLQKMIAVSAKLSELAPKLREPASVYDRTNEFCRNEAN